MSSISSIFKAIMTRFSYGAAAYIRTYAVAGGSEDLYPAGESETSMIDIPLDHVPKTKKLRPEDIVSPATVSIGDMRVILFFGPVVTQEVFDAANGLVIGGTYDEDTSQVSGGEFYAIRKETVTLLFTESGPVTGAEFICAYKG